MSKYRELIAKAEALMAEAESVRMLEIKEVIHELRGKIATYNLTAEDLGLTHNGNSKNRRSSNGRLTRFVGPKGETWSGRGRQPTWLVTAIKGGVAKESFAVR